jgi:hypothetical protein
MIRAMIARNEMQKSQNYRELVGEWFDIQRNERQGVNCCWDRVQGCSCRAIGVPFLQPCKRFLLPCSPAIRTRSYSCGLSA